MPKTSKVKKKVTKTKTKTSHKSKVKRVSKPFARKIQILTVGEQRAKVMGKNKVASIFKRGKESIRRRCKECK